MPQFAAVCNGRVQKLLSFVSSIASYSTDQPFDVITFRYQILAKKVFLLIRNPEYLSLCIPFHTSSIMGSIDSP